MKKIIINSQNKALVVNGNTLMVDYGEPVTINSTRIKAWINTSNKWATADDSYSIAVPVTVGKTYVLEFSTTDSSIVGTIFRYGFASTKTPTSAGVSLSGCVRTSIQASPRVSVVASNIYLIIQFGSSLAASFLNSGYFTITEFD